MPLYCCELQYFISIQDQWIRGQPILVANSSDLLDENLWTPNSFLRDFGHLKHPLINCLKGTVVPDAPMSAFWKGFECLRERLRDADGNSMVLKLKDWPPNDDLAEYMPERYAVFGLLCLVGVQVLI